MKIFEPCFTTKIKGEGAWLGLAVVHGIVRAHRGIIKVYSEIGGGTTFQVYLPVLPGRRDDLPAHELPPENIVGGNEHILYVDKEARLTQLVRKALEKYGYRVSSFTESEQALALGIREYCEKPLSMHNLVRTVRQVLDGR